MKTINDIVVEKLCKLMEEKNLTQYKLAMLSELPFPTVKSIMQKRTKNITLKTIILLSKGLQVSPCEFVNDKLLSDDIDLD